MAKLCGCVLARVLLVLALLLTGTVGNALAEPLKVTPGLWEVTTLLRNFDLSADGRREIDNGGSGPNVEHQCITERGLQAGFRYPGQTNPIIAKSCKFTTIAETSDLVDSVIECAAYDGVLPYIVHTVVVAPAPEVFTTIVEITWTSPLTDGRIARSVTYARGKWVRNSCDN
jgi:hypothetical protein